MMSLKSVLAGVDRTEADGIACADLRSGRLLAVSPCDERSREALELAALAAVQLCTATRLDALFGDTPRAREALVVSKSAIHAFALSPRRPDRVVVGVANGSANVALLLASVRSVADAVVD